jgi:hypothetical protein
MNVNPVVIWLLRSPLYRLLSRTTMLVTYQGRKSGRQITLPVNYVRDGELLYTLSVGSRAWWRNFRAAGPATLRLQGRDLPVQGVVVENEAEQLAGLGVFFKGMPQAARYLKIWFDEHGEPDPDDLRDALKGRVLLRFQPCPLPL